MLTITRCVGAFAAGLLALTGVTACSSPCAVTVESPTSNSTGVTLAPVSSFADIVQAVVPSVVFISGLAPPDSNGVIAEVAGSGVIMSSDGYILTNKHVVHDLESVRVTLEDSAAYQVTGKWMDDAVDLAVIKIDARGLTPMTFADPDQLRVGDWVIALGHALGLKPTEGGLSVTSGVVSNLGRSFSLNGVEQYDVIQTDAAINPGNSGGPLVNLKGELVGINTAVVVGAENIGFALSSGIAQHVYEDLVRYGRPHHPYLGITPGDTTATIARAQGCACNSGAFVSSVAPTGPAADGGIRTGDIIVSFDGKAVNSAASLVKWLWRREVGDEVQIVLMRSGSMRTITVVLGERRSESGI